MPDFFKDLGLAMPVESLDEEVTEEVLVPAARQQMAIDRQRMLLMMVMMGINRLVVTDGSIKAAVIFQLNTTDLGPRRRSTAATGFESTAKTKSRSGIFSGWFSPSWKTENEDQAQRHHHPGRRVRGIRRAEGEADRRCERPVQERRVPADGDDHLARPAGAGAPDDAGQDRDRHRPRVLMVTSLLAADPGRRSGGMAGGARRDHRAG